MKSCPRNIRYPLAFGLALLALACGEPTGTRPAGELGLLGAPGATLIECPTKEVKSATAVIDALGGTLEVDGSSIALPPGAVTVPTLFTLTVPASQYMEVEVTAGGLETLLFELPVSITIGYQRCTRGNIDRYPLHAEHIDTETKALLENMGGTDDKVARAVTFTTGHLSSYAIAY